MNRFTIAILFLSCLILSCSRENVTRADAAILGKWKLVFESDGLSPLITSPSPDIGHVLTISNNDEWSIVQNGSTKNSGTYQTTFEKTYSGKDVKRLDLYSTNTVSTSKEYYEITHDTLVFNAGLAGIIGGGIKYYKKE